MAKKTLFILLVVLTGSVFGQNKIMGYAPDFIGQTVNLYTYQDYLTLNKVKIGEGVVSAEDSTFTITCQANSTIKGIIEIERTEASLYLEPEGEYEVYFPASNEPLSYKNTVTNLYFYSLDTLDINYRVLQYHEWFDTYIAYHEKDIIRNGFLTYLDSFSVYASDFYKEVEDPFFITYVRYDLAEMQQTFGGNRSSEKRLETFLNYIEPYPVYNENDRYMKFILAFYDKEFGEYLPVTEKEIMNAIYRSSPTLLMKALQSDIFLAEPQLRELVMIDKLGKAFYKESNFRPNIIAILDSVANHANTQTNAAVAKNVKNYITNLEAGFPAPALQINLDGNKGTGWSRYKGKFVYFNFFATWNDRAVNEMEIISKLVDKYDEDISFLSVCTDEDSVSYNAFMKEHPTYDWDIAYVGNDKNLMNSFKVTSVPSYFLIDQEGFIFSAPALAPSPNGEYESIEKTLFMIKKALHPEEKVRVGEK